jgi:imidazoleglycerol phosphate synthase glutamine amidotransferase subunit HisH
LIKVNITTLGVGNKQSVHSYLNWLGFNSQSNNELLCDEPLIIAGVSSLMNNTYMESLIGVVNSRVKHNKITLGICAGYQIFFSGSEETNLKYKSIYPQIVKRIHLNGKSNIGYFKIYEDSEISGSSTAYFCHTYGVNADECNFNNKKYIKISDKKILAMFTDGALMGVQFHPEKSINFNHELINNHLRS